MAKVAKKLEEKETWMNSKMIEFSKTATFQTPNIRPSEIMSAKKVMYLVSLNYFLVGNLIKSKLEEKQDLENQSR